MILPLKSTLKAHKTGQTKRLDPRAVFRVEYASASPSSIHPTVYSPKAARSVSCVFTAKKPFTARLCRLVKGFDLYSRPRTITAGTYSLTASASSRISSGVYALIPSPTRFPLSVKVCKKYFFAPFISLPISFISSFV